MDHIPTARGGGAWRVTFDDRCSLCEICVTRCPTRALAIEKTDLIEKILFDAGPCDGCGGSPACREHCPEQAVTVVAADHRTLPAGAVVLVSGQLARCVACGTTFMPERKLAALLEKQVITAKPVQAYCPECRRQGLLERYMDRFS